MHFALLLLTLVAYARVSFVDEKGTRHYVETEAEIPTQFRKKDPAAQDRAILPPASVAQPAPSTQPATVVNATAATLTPMAIAIAPPLQEVRPKTLPPGESVPEAPPMDVAALEKLANDPKDSFAKRWSALRLKQYLEFVAVNKDLKSASLPECAGKTTLSACLLDWYPRHPPTTSTTAAGNMALAMTAASIDRKVKSTPSDYFAITLAELELAAMEAVDVKKFEILTQDWSGLLEATEKFAYRKQESTVMQQMQDRIGKIVHKLLAQIDEKASPANLAAMKDRIEDVKKRLEIMEKRDFSL